MNNKFLPQTDIMHTPDIWGPHYWYVFHMYAHAYPDYPNDVQIEVAKTFIKSIPYLLPCTICASHSYSFIRMMVPNLHKITSNRTNLVEFFRIFHNHVNDITGKQKLVL